MDFFVQNLGEIEDDLTEFEIELPGCSTVYAFFYDKLKT